VDFVLLEHSLLDVGYIASVNTSDVNPILSWKHILILVHETTDRVVQGAAEWTPTFIKVAVKGVVWVGRRGRWQQFGQIV
jgi:hypothetical protein